MKKGILIKCVLILITGGLVSSAFYSCGSAQKLGSDKEGNWELMILDAQSDTTNGYNLAAADIDGDGKQEIIMGGVGALSWYRPATFEKGPIAKGNFSVGLWLEDIDACGKPEVIVGAEYPDKPNMPMLVWFKPGKDLNQPWEQHVIDQAFRGAHDILFADLDGDGERDLLSITANSAPGIYAFKRGQDIKSPWVKHVVSEGIFTEGLNVSDLSGDDRLEIVCGPDWYTQPEGGAFSGQWVRHTYAPNFREMCRTAIVDINRDGHPDIVITDSEYMDGFLSWFENRADKDPSNPWIEHRLEDGMIYAHSLEARYDPKRKETLIFVAEMEQGGWNAPYNYDARLMTFLTKDDGRSWVREVLYKGEGTHQAIMHDIDGDGELEIIGKTCSQVDKTPRMQIWKNTRKPALDVSFRHTLIERDKLTMTTELMAADVDYDGKADVVIGTHWYKNPEWRRYSIPGIYQVINNYDIDKDGKAEFIALKRNLNAPSGNNSAGLPDGEICWIKPVDPENVKWEEYPIGKINADLVSGIVIAPLLPGGKPALLIGYNNSKEKSNPAELCEIPDDPKSASWNRRVLANVNSNEELIPYDLDNDGLPDLAGAQYWYHNQGDGTFKGHLTDEKHKAARIVLSDLNGDKGMDIIAGQEVIDYTKRFVPFSQLLWLENPNDTSDGQWKRHVIDLLRSPTSLGVADIDGDGENEIIAGEYDPFWTYRKRCRLMAYKKANPQGTAWYRYLIDGRFEHHNGAKIFEIEPGRTGILSKGWQDKKYIHLWEIVKN